MRYLPNNHKQLTFTSIVNIGAQPRPRGGGQVTQDPVPGQLRVGGGHGGGSGLRCRHLARQEEPRAPPTMSPALARSCPRSGPCPPVIWVMLGHLGHSCYPDILSASLFEHPVGGSSRTQIHISILYVYKSHVFNRTS